MDTIDRISFSEQTQLLPIFYNRLRNSKNFSLIIVENVYTSIIEAYSRADRHDEALRYFYESYEMGRLLQKWEVTEKTLSTLLNPIKDTETLRKFLKMLKPAFTHVIPQKFLINT